MRAFLVVIEIGARAEKLEGAFFELVELVVLHAI